MYNTVGHRLPYSQPTFDGITLNENARNFFIGFLSVHLPDFGVRARNDSNTRIKS